MLTTIPIIEKGIPVPERGKGGQWQRLLRQMEIGDSILIPASEKSGARNLRYAAKTLGHKHSQRTQEDGSIRVWRIE